MPSYALRPLDGPPPDAGGDPLLLEPGTQHTVTVRLRSGGDGGALVGESTITVDVPGVTALAVSAATGGPIVLSPTHNVPDGVAHAWVCFMDGVEVDSVNDGTAAEPQLRLQAGGEDVEPTLPEHAYAVRLLVQGRLAHERALSAATASEPAPEALEQLAWVPNALTDLAFA